MEQIRLHPECISCIVRKQLDRCPEEAALETKVEYMQRVLRLVADAPRSAGAPLIVYQIGKVQEEMFGCRRDFTDIKIHFNEVMLAREAEILEETERAEDPLKAAIQYAMVGNYIDFGAMQNVDEKYLDELLGSASGQPVDEAVYRKLRRGLADAGRVVYITDNCGEIVLDKLLIRRMRMLNPRAEITVLTRGGQALNDATVEDARQTGLDREVRVIGNGSDIAGTCWEYLSAEAQEAIGSADLIFSKGQANFETMQGCGRNIFYLFMCKCARFEKRFQTPLYQGVLLHEDNLTF